MPKLTTELIKDNDTWTLKLIGNVNSATLHKASFIDNDVSLSKRLARSGAKKLFIDLMSTESIDSEGFRILLNTQKEFADEGIQIVLKNPNPHMKRLLRMMKFDRTFDIEPNDS